jgi:hypothetical protein
MRKKKYGRSKNPVITPVITIILTVLFAVSLSAAVDNSNKVKKKIDQLVQKQLFKKAESYCIKQGSKKKFDGLIYLTDFYLEQGKFTETIQFLDSFKYRVKTADPVLFQQRARAYMGMGKIKDAIPDFEQSPPSIHRADAYRQRADLYLKENDPGSAKTFYLKAIQEYSHLMKDLFFQWETSYNKGLRASVRAYEKRNKTAEEKEHQALLEKVLNGSARYCDKMKNSAFHFFCKEQVTETLDFILEYRAAGGWGSIGGGRRDATQPVSNTFVYMYQLLQEGKKINESRVLVKQNGIERNIPDSKLQISGARYEKLIFGPIVLLSKLRQPQYYYRLLRQENLWGETAVVVEALPIYSAFQMFGKIWISTVDYSIMKIEWNPKSIGQARLMAKRSKRFNAQPRAEFYAEFKQKKRGIRFPSKYYFEESYILHNKEKQERMILDVDFSEYMFFVVGSEVIEAKADTDK